jgi:hypothetical protein
MTQRGLLAVEGSGKRGDPFRYSPPGHHGVATSEFARESSTDAVIRNYQGQESRSDAKNPESEIRIRGDHIGDGGDPNPGSGKNDGVEPTSGSPNFGSPHRTYNSEGSPGDGPDGQDLDPADPPDGSKIEPIRLNSETLIDGVEGGGDTSDYPQAQVPPENGPLRERGGPPGHLDPDAARLCADCWERGVVKMGYIICRDGVRRCGACASVAVIIH